MGTDFPPIDMDQALEEFDNDQEFLREVIFDFLQNLKQQITIMRRAIGANDLKTLKQEAHAIKGGAANLTAGKLTKAARELEQAADPEEGNNLAPLLEKIEREYESLALFIRGFLNGAEN